MSNVEIKDYNVLIDLQPFYDIPIKNKEETYKNIIELFNHDNYTTGNSFDYEYFSKHYKLIAISLSKQNSDFKNQQINFIGKLENNAAIFFIIEGKMTTGIKFEQNSLTIVLKWNHRKLKIYQIIKKILIQNIKQNDGILLMIKIMDNMVKVIIMMIQ